jgi:hypothetical protein
LLSHVMGRSMLGGDARHVCLLYTETFTSVFDRRHKLLQPVSA